jgi:hypothetical protein
MYFEEVVYKEVTWNNLAQKRALCPTLVITATNLGDSQNVGYFLSSWAAISTNILSLFHGISNSYTD